MKFSTECMTVVVPVFNRPALIERCLDSIKAQTWRPLHVIVVDNGSTDNTMQKVAQWKSENEEEMLKVSVLEESRKGAAYARQTGLEQVATEVVSFFDSDDTMRPDCIATVMQAWRKNPDADVVAWPVARHKDTGVQVTHTIKGNPIEKHLVHAILQTQGYAVKTQYLKDVGGWRGEYPNWNDYETGVRVLLNSPKVAAVDRPLVDVYPQKESITGVNFSNKCGLWEKSLAGILDSIEKSGRKDTGRLKNIVAYRKVILAAHYAREGREDLARPLLRQALREAPASKRYFLRFSYHWTLLHLRGAFLLVGPFL